jgi:hypothetical protein
MTRSAHEAPRVKMSITSTTAAALAVVAVLAGQVPHFTFAGLDLDSDLDSIAKRYPQSTRVGDYLYVSPRDCKTSISGIELSGAGPTRRLRIAFESRGSNGRPVYPVCGDVQRGIEKSYGKPMVREFSEEASRRSDRIWRSAGEQMTLICFANPGRATPLFAEAVVIVPR